MIFLVRHVSILMLALVCLIPTESARAQTADKLVIDGPELETCAITVRYFKARRIVKVISLKLSLLKGGIEESIEAGFDGVEVFLQSRAVPIQVSLLAGEKRLSSEQLKESGAATISVGKIGRVEFTPEDIELKEADQRMLKAYIDSLNARSSTQNLVAATDEASIDYQCLDVFNREMRQRIGSVDFDASLKNFMAWDGTASERIVAGVLRGDAGVCGVRLIISEGKLLDLQPNCPKLVDDYLREPLETGEYVKRSEQLIKHLCNGQAQQAHQLYAPQFQKKVTVEQLSKLSEMLRERFGKDISSVTVKRIQLLDYNFSQKTCLLLIDLILDFDEQTRCLGRVTFAIPCDRNQVGKGCLAGVNVSQVYQSSYPQYAKMTQVMLEQLGEPLKAESLLGIFHPNLRPLCDKDKLQLLLNRLGEHVRGLPPMVDFDLWTVSQFQDLVQASGSLKFGEKDYYAELQFAGENYLTGFSFYGPALAESTLGLLSFPSAIEGTAKQFWTHLLNSDAESAHAMLDIDFQSQFPLEEMKKQLAEPEVRPSKLKDIRVDFVRLSNEVARPVIILANVYLTAEYEDGQVQQVTCDVAMPLADSKALIYDFTNEFEVDFPVSSIPLTEIKGDGADLAIEAFRAKDPQKLLQLIEPSRKELIDLATLSAYFENFAAIAGQLAEPISTARTVEYQAGGKRFRCNLNFKDTSNEELPVELWFHGGYLERFIVSHAKINDFHHLLKDKSGVRRRVEAFVRAWFGDGNEMRPFMLSSLYSERTLGALKAMKSEFEERNGKLSNIQISNERSVEGSGEIEFTVTLEGESGSRDARVLVDIGAFGGLVSAVTLQ